MRKRINEQLDRAIAFHLRLYVEYPKVIWLSTQDLRRYRKWVETGAVVFDPEILPGPEVITYRGVTIKELT